MNLSTIKKILVTLGQIMAYAVRHGYIDYNPVRDAERPRGNGESEESEIRVLTPAEINALLDAESDMKCHTLFMLALFSGAKQGELLGSKMV
jgi:integrase